MILLWYNLTIQKSNEISPNLDVTYLLTRSEAHRNFERSAESRALSNRLSKTFELKFLQLPNLARWNIFFLRSTIRLPIAEKISSRKEKGDFSFLSPSLFYPTYPKVQTSVRSDLLEIGGPFINFSALSCAWIFSWSLYLGNDDWDIGIKRKDTIPMTFLCLLNISSWRQKLRTIFCIKKIRRFIERDNP